MTTAMERMSRESRLRCMLGRTSLDGGPSLWNLNDDDRDAILWAFERIKTLEEDLDRVRGERMGDHERFMALRNQLDRIREACK